MNSHIRIISHCWAEKNRQFAAALSYQLGSLILFPPKSRVSISVVCLESDKYVDRVIQRFINQVQITPWYLPLNKLGRRSIGRDGVARCLSSSVTAVWFADCDYVFRAGCLDALADYQWPDDVVAVFPKMVKISKTHAYGDLTLREMLVPMTADVNPDGFEDKKYFRAIGGAQIVRGDIARLGYLHDDPKWQKPTTTPFRDTREDVYYRRELEQRGRIVGIDLPNCFRLRHSEGHPK